MKKKRNKKRMWQNHIDDKGGFQVNEKGEKI